MDVSIVASTSVRATADIHSMQKNIEACDECHDHGQDDTYQRERALGVFQQEMRTTMKSSFRAKFAVPQGGYAQAAPAADDVAAETLGAAKQLVAESPTNSGKALISFRAKVHETASYVRETVGVRDDIAEVDDAIAKIDDGLNTLEEEVAANRESSASVLNVEMRSKQRSSIRIRTQEGDVVKLSISRRDRMEASDTAVSDANGTASTTEVEISSRSRMTLKVDGDLNDAEMAAIQNVFAQAEDIANQFFNGDIGAAFELAAGVEFDTEQLARVNMGFRSFQSSEISYRETSVTRLTAPPPAAPVATPPGDSDTSSVATATAVAATDAVEAPAANTAVADEPAAPAIDSSALADFFGLLSNFLRSVGSGFDGGDTTDKVSFRLHHSESFKLTILKSVMHAAAPDEPAEAAATALIDGIAAGAEDQKSIAA